MNQEYSESNKVVVTETVWSASAQQHLFSLRSVTDDLQFNMRNFEQS